MKHWKARNMKAVMFPGICNFKLQLSLNFTVSFNEIPDLCRQLVYIYKTYLSRKWCGAKNSGIYCDIESSKYKLLIQQLFNSAFELICMDMDTFLKWIIV